MRTLEDIVIEVMDDDYSNQVITETTSLRNDLGFDSFKLAQLTVEIEDEYEVDIFDQGNIDTIGEIQNIINSTS